MPRKLIRRWMPDPEKVTRQRGLRWLGPLLEDPNLFHLTRHSVSLAFMVGVFMAFIPIPFQMLVAALLALWLRCNLPIAAGLVWITNPLTMPPMFYGAYLVGCLLLNMEPTLTLEAIWQWFNNLDGNWLSAIDWEWLKNEGAKFLKPLVLGSLACATVFGFLSYWAVRLLWRWHVVHNWGKRKQRK
ncbi:DUF2062 domain-containing protein [bacterium SCSIO 12696]|nr:DUF2062 domain-containing protein [bacterium SCSIO 12696]